MKTDKQSVNLLEIKLTEVEIGKIVQGYEIQGKSDDENPMIITIRKDPNEKRAPFPSRSP